MSPIFIQRDRSALAELVDDWRTPPRPRERRRQITKGGPCACPPGRWSATAPGQLAHAAFHLPVREAAVLYWMAEHPAEVLSYEDFNVRYWPDKIGGPFISRKTHLTRACSIIRRALYAYAVEWRIIPRWKVGYELIQVAPPAWRVQVTAEPNGAAS